MKSIILHLADEADTLSTGRALSKIITPGLVIFLQGPLGAGKTTLVRALLRALGVEGPVKSPTYNLVEVHVVSSLYLYHFDFFRFTDPHEWEDSGFREYFNNQSVCLVEWPEKAAPLLPQADLSVILEIAGSGRSVKLEAGTERGSACLMNLESSAELAKLIFYPHG